MIYISHLFLGFISAFVALLAPGMLNMTAVKTTLEQDKKAGFVYSSGAILVIVIQVSIALIFSNYISRNPNILDNLKFAAIIVFFALAVVFFFQARKNMNVKVKAKRGNLFFIGIVMSALNMLSIPFYFALTIYLNAHEYLNMEQPYIALFILGTALGSILVFFLYVLFSSTIAKRAKFIATNINYILSGLFLVLGLIAVVNRYY